MVNGGIVWLRNDELFASEGMFMFSWGKHILCSRAVLSRWVLIKSVSLWYVLFSINLSTGFQHGYLSASLTFALHYAPNTYCKHKRLTPDCFCEIVDQ